MSGIRFWLDYNKLLENVCVCVYYQCSPGDLWYPVVGSREVNYKKANSGNPAQNGNKHDPAESRQIEIICPTKQNPY